jgi:hypothetical protein
MSNLDKWFTEIRRGVFVDVTGGRHAGKTGHVRSVRDTSSSIGVELNSGQWIWVDRHLCRPVWEGNPEANPERYKWHWREYHKKIRHLITGEFFFPAMSILGLNPKMRMTAHPGRPFPHGRPMSGRIDLIQVECWALGSRLDSEDEGHSTESRKIDWQCPHQLITWHMLKADIDEEELNTSSVMGDWAGILSEVTEMEISFDPSGIVDPNDAWVKLYAGGSMVVWTTMKEINPLIMKSMRNDTRVVFRPTRALMPWRDYIKEFPLDLELKDDINTGYWDIQLT